MNRISLLISLTFVVAFYTFYFYKQRTVRIQDSVSYVALSPSIDELSDPAIRKIYADNYPADRDHRYTLEESMKHTQRILDIHRILHTDVNDDAKANDALKRTIRPLLEEAIERQEDALNAFIVSEPSPSPKDTAELKRILENRIFEIYDIARKLYEDEPVSTLSYPVSYDTRTPAPVSNDTFAYDKVYVGTVQP